MKKTAMLVFALGTAAAGCSPVDQATLNFRLKQLQYILADRARLQAELSAAREKWEQAGITSYEYTSRHSCFCPTDPPLNVVIRVEDGEIVEVTGMDGTLVGSGDFDHYRTIEGLLDLAQSRLEHEINEYSYYEIEFDAELGFQPELRRSAARMWGMETRPWNLVI